MKGLLQIGELARLGDVSVKALRFYDEQGLLRPEHVDRQTGYRYYTVDQAALLAIITNLRLVDFSIAEIAALLRNGAPGPDALNAAIEQKQHDLRCAREAITNKIKIATILMQAPYEPCASFSLRFAPVKDELVYSVRQRVPNLGESVKEIFETAETVVAAHDARARSAPFLIFHDPPDKKENLDLEVCIPVTDDAPAHLPVAVIHGADIACACVYAGGYAKTDTLFTQITNWIEKAQLNAAGPLREIYHRFGAEQEDYRLPAKMTANNNRDYLTELKIPIEMKFNVREKE